MVIAVGPRARIARPMKEVAECKTSAGGKPVGGMLFIFSEQLSQVGCDERFVSIQRIDSSCRLVAFC